MPYFQLDPTTMKRRGIAQEVVQKVQAQVSRQTDVDQDDDCSGIAICTNIDSQTATTTTSGDVDGNIDQIIRQLNDCDDVVAPAEFCENDANQDVTATATE